MINFVRKKVTPEESFQHRLLEALEGTEITDSELAGRCSCSITTVRRWKEGSSSPHRIFEPLVFKIINELKDGQG